MDSGLNRSRLTTLVSSSSGALTKYTWYPSSSTWNSCARNTLPPSVTKTLSPRIGVNSGVSGAGGAGVAGAGGAGVTGAGGAGVSGAGGADGAGVDLSDSALNVSFSGIGASQSTDSVSVSLESLCTGVSTGAAGGVETLFLLRGLCGHCLLLIVKCVLEPQCLHCVSFFRLRGPACSGLTCCKAAFRLLLSVTCLFTMSL